MRKNKNCVKAETETYKIQKPVPNTPAYLCTMSVLICFQLLEVYRNRKISNSEEMLLKINKIHSIYYFLSQKNCGESHFVRNPGKKYSINV